ncbi:hypothetical protein OSB04_028025 [Centaurea solstitialis]|uniref:CCHC-type domain-containing protein n=1 Tax=Centaurea solstitialis TaxID=347529 RepID=A0AA38W8U4_9ASTR|nr:hypothetical protein OSB04_028025 [Centaurea solstitialis]
MASTVTSTNNLSLRSILEKDKLTGSNFLDWERNLMIVLRHERKWYVLEEPLGEAPPANAPAAARNAHKKHSDDLLDVACLMLATMSPDLQTGLINTNAYDMIRQLRDMFQTQARTERYDATKAFNECKMVKGTSVSDHVMKMKRHLDHLERLGHPVPLQLATDTILNSLSEDYRPFVVNYNMNNMEKTIAELHSMLKTAELNMGNKNKTKDVLMVKDGGVKKKNGHASTSKGKGPVQAIQSAPKKGKGKGKGKKVKPNKARTENRCFICNEIGHWRQNCPKRHEAGRNHSSTQQLRKVAVLHIQELEVSPEERSLVDYGWTKFQAIQFDPRIPTKTQQDPPSIEEEDPSEDSDATTSETPVRSPAPVPPPPAPRSAPEIPPPAPRGLRIRTTARKSVPLPMRVTLTDPPRTEGETSRLGARSETTQVEGCPDAVSVPASGSDHDGTVGIILSGDDAIMSPRIEDSEIARLVTEQLVAVLPEIVSQVAAGLNANQGNNLGAGAIGNRECTYKAFRSCNPKEFHGTEGAVGLLTWIEGMESVLHISKCTEGNKVEFAACLLQGRALTWWNTQVQTRGREATNRLTWEKFKKLLKEEYCPRSEIQKLEAELWNHEMMGSDIDSYTARFHELAKLVPHLVTPEEN